MDAQTHKEKSCQVTISFYLFYTIFFRHYAIVHYLVKIKEKKGKDREEEWENFLILIILKNDQNQEQLIFQMLD